MKLGFLKCVHRDGNGIYLALASLAVYNTFENPGFTFSMGLNSYLTTGMHISHIAQITWLVKMFN